MTWDATTAYANDYQYQDGVLTATFRPTDAAQAGVPTYACKIKWNTEETSGLPTGSRLGLSPNESALTFWVAGSGAPDPSAGDELTIESAGWAIVNVRKGCRSRWFLTVRKQK